MVKGRGQQASEKTWNINRALSELRGLVREEPPSLWAIANLVWRYDQGDVMLDYALGALPADKHEAFQLQLKLTPALYRGEPIEIPQPLPPIWRKLELTNISLEGANLMDFDLSGLKMVNADLTGATLAFTLLPYADLRGADLTGADLFRSNLFGADLTGADLTGADLVEADLTRAYLDGANLTGVYLRYTDLSGAVYDAATIWPEGFDMSRLG